MVQGVTTTMTNPSSTKELPQPPVSTTCSSSQSDDSVALLFDSHSNSCGHRLPISELLHHIRKETHGGATCPICRLPITRVKDVLAANFQEQSSMSSSAGRVVTIKYGTLIYDLSVPSDHSLDPATLTSRRPVWSSWLLWGIPSQHSTVQARVAQVLGLRMTDMKILCRGRVLYPPAQSSSNETDEKRVSDLLWEHGGTLHGKPQLLVMGTVEDEQLSQRNGLSDSGGGGLWNQLLGLSRRVIVSTLNLSVSIILAILQKIQKLAVPLLTRNMDPSDEARHRD